MTTWDPGQYLKFADHRLRPALDLLARIPVKEPNTIWDLGCGPGNVTQFLKERWPAARVVGLDSSAATLEKARAIAGIDWVKGDIADWHADMPVSLVYSNAALHWVPNHATLFPHLMRQIERGGALAAQMPRNFDSPSHTLLYDTAREGPWAPHVDQALGKMYVQAPDRYYDLLVPLATHIDIWEVEYLHVLQGDNAVLEWTKGTAVRPLLDAMPAAMHTEFLSLYAARLAKAYPKRIDGMTLFPFRRLFIVAVR